MAKVNIVKKIEELAIPLVESFGLEIWGMEYLPMGKRSVLRLYVDVPAGGAPEAFSNDEVLEDAAGDGAMSEDFASEGVTVSQCAKLSRHLALAIEVEDVVPGAFNLEVSSPGLERIFFQPAQMASYVGRDVEIVAHDALLEEPFVGRKRFTGPLVSVDGDKISLTVRDADEECLEFVWDDIKKVHLVHEFPDNTPQKVKDRAQGKKKTKKSKKKKR